MHIHPNNRAICESGLLMTMDLSEGKENWIKTEIEVMLGQQMICAVGKNEWPN
jgi:regulation of enolase protein 1 (concanavalin A-like superfamily)